MKFIEDIDVENKKVILRLDLNVPIKNNQVLDDIKIKMCIKTINYLLNKGCNVLIMSHLGKIKNEEDKPKNSLKIVATLLSNILKTDVNFIDSTRGEKLKKSFYNNRITLMENTRYEDYPSKLESSCDEGLAKYWASLGEIFINDAFGTSHRKHASNYGISKYLESGYGYLINEELKGLKPVVSDIKRPFVVIMGGAKVDDKVKVIEKILDECDYLLVGGGIANTFLKASGINIASSLYSEDYVDNLANLIKKHQKKIIMPIDTVVLDNEKVFIEDVKNIKSGSICDIGPKTSALYDEILLNAGTIFLNGTVGIYEDDRFSLGTINLFNSLKKADAIKIAGGGDALSSINNLNYNQYFSYLSTGGGATLEYIINKSMKCFEGEK